MERQSSQSFPAITEDDSIIPPPAPSGTGDRDSDWYRAQITKARRDSKAALSMATSASTAAATATDGVKRIEDSIGHSPDPARGIKGAGLLGVVSDAVDQMQQDREERMKRRAAWSAAGKGAAVAIGAIGALFGVLSKIFHW